jgi:hypothetical protein
MYARERLELLEYANRIVNNHGWPVVVSVIPSSKQSSVRMVVNSREKLELFAGSMIVAAQVRGQSGVHVSRP